MLLTNDSVKIHEDVLGHATVLRRLSRARLTDKQMTQICRVLDTLAGHCLTPHDPLRAHAVNQNIISHNVPSVVLDLLLTTKSHRESTVSSSTVDLLLTRCVHLLRALSYQNDLIQSRIFDHFFVLLDVDAVHSDIALLIRDAFTGNRSTCRKVTCRHVNKLIELLCKFGDEVPEYLDVLYAMVRVVGVGAEAPLRHNQTLVMKYLMSSFAQVAVDFSSDKDVRMEVLSGVKGPAKQRYLSCLVGLLAACAEGENRLAHSMCRTILPVDDLLDVLNLSTLDNNVKKSFLFYLNVVYVSSPFNTTEMGPADLSHRPSLWCFMEKLLADVILTCKYIRDNVTQLDQLINTSLTAGKPLNVADRRAMIHANLHYILDTVLPFLFIYLSRLYSPDAESYPREPDIIDKLTNALLSLSELIRHHVVQPRHINSLISTAVLLLITSSLPRTTLDKFIDDYKAMDWVGLHETDAQQSFCKYYAEELSLNSQFRQFIINASLLYGGYNTVAAQLQINSRWARNKEYTRLACNKSLPLGTYFQDHVRSLIQPNHRKPHKQLALLRNVVRQLGFSTALLSERRNDSWRQRIKALTIKSLQLLRAVIYNEIVKLPDDWKQNIRSHSATLKRISSIQNYYLDINIFQSLMPLTSSKHDEDIMTQALSLVNCLLFNANTTVQSAMLVYFRSTRKEPLFICLRDSMQLFISAFKESRACSSAQCRSTVNELESVMRQKKLKVVLMEFRKARQPIRAYDEWLQQLTAEPASVFSSASFEELQYVAFRRSTQSHRTPDTGVSDAENGRSTVYPADKQSKKDSEPVIDGGSPDWIVFDARTGLTTDKGIELLVIDDAKSQTSSLVVDDDVSRVTSDTATLSLIDMSITDADADDDEGHMTPATANRGNLDLVLSILAGMCDGQFTDLQNYVRDQPDNVQSVKLVTETVAVLDSLYLNINSDSATTITNIFSTLNEFTSGNQVIRAELIDCRVIDYVNVILRMSEFPGCTHQQVIALQLSMASLVYSLIEENGPRELLVAMDVKDTLDHSAVCKLITSCYVKHQVEKPRTKDALNIVRFARLRWGGAAKLRKSYKDVGFAYFIIMRRFCDIDPSLQHIYFDTTLKEKVKKAKAKLDGTGEAEAISSLQRKAFSYYAAHTQSIEVVKDDCIQKVNFRVRDKKIVREEIREMMKWEVDRTSPSEKLRDFHQWYKDIRREIRYQKMVLNNFFMRFITRNWNIWCYACMLLSLIINVFMLITWQARMSMADLQDTTSTLPDALFDPQPKYLDEVFQVDFIYVAGLLHNVFACLVFIGYCVANNPQLPDVRRVFVSISESAGGSKTMTKKMMKTGSDENKSKIAVQVFSIKTFYYIGFLVCSWLGTFYWGYFFAFHLLHIINTNVLLGAAIKAVTVNGPSLVWVAILGVVIIYIYSLAGFAFLRDVFNPANHVYCASLTQCFVSVVRYGLIGDYDEDRINRPAEDPGDEFINFVLLSLYKVSFFIVVTTIILNLVFGIILDTFSELRNKKWTAEADMRDYCFICGINSYKFEHRAYGFLLHVNQEHNMWSYMHFMLQLSNTDPTDYTALELHVHRLMEAENLNFFPMNRALSLAREDVDETDTKLDELIAQVDLLVRKQREQEAEKLRETARLRQQRWQQAHQRLYRPPTSHRPAAADATDDDDDDDSETRL